jgi:hypothetical protein
MVTEFRITASLKPNYDEPPSNKRIKNVLYSIGLVQVSVVSLPITRCEWVTANSMVGYEVIKCPHMAEFITKDDEKYCLPHADLYRTITSKTPERISNQQVEE